MGLGGFHSQSGTTSACAENTRFPRLWSNVGGNYLRVRGEYLMMVKPLLVRLELPPRARRILGSEVDSGHGPGTTSACAENTAPLFSSSG